MNNEAKFTKGEWKVHSVGSQFSVGPLSSADDQSNGMMNVVAWIEKFDYFTEKQSECNANLIAAAPEMYEMLNSARKELCTLIDEVNDQRASRITSTTETEPDYHDQETLYLIDKLLAKARGE